MATEKAPAADATDATAAAADEGKVLNIYCWNDEFHFTVTSPIVPVVASTSAYPG